MKKILPFLLAALVFPASVRPVQGSRLAEGTDIPVPILAYHNIGPQALSEWYVSAEQFERQMDVLQAYGYQTVGLQDYLDYRNGVTPPAKPIIITFDDGYQGVYIYALPILQARGMTASIFIPTGKIGEDEAGRINNSWLGHEPLSYHLIWPEVVELAEAGFEIGSHTVSHPVLTDLDDEQAQYEIHSSQQAILDHLNDFLPDYPVDFFAYPHGIGADDPAIRGSVQANYLAAVGYLDDLVADNESDLYELPRRAIYSDISFELDPDNPWPFFMRRVDPLFPTPNIIPTNWDSPYDPDPWQVLDADGLPREHFYPGETVTIKASLKCGESPVPVTASLLLQHGESTLYDSHLASADVALDPLPSGWLVTDFTYQWTIPREALSGMYSGTVSVRDHSYLLGFYRSASETLFEVVRSTTYLPFIAR